MRLFGIRIGLNMAARKTNGIRLVRIGAAVTRKTYRTEGGSGPYFEIGLPKHK